MGWKVVKVNAKHKYVYFVGPRKKLLAKLCRYQVLPYPKLSA